MNMIPIKYCPGTLAKGYDTYSPVCLNKMFHARKVSHILPYDAPDFSLEIDNSFEDNLKQISISGVQEKFSLVLEKNKLRLAKEGEMGEYILKPCPIYGKNRDQMPANEHLSMQIASQIYGIHTAENAIIFFKNGVLAHIIKRFDYNDKGNKLAQEDFASLTGRTTYSHGKDYKYLGNYLELFQVMKKHVVSYKIEAIKLFKLLVFNYLFLNGDAHLKNFSLLETSMGDFCLSPAYDLLNSRIHIDDRVFALEDGLLPRNMAHGKIRSQFEKLADLSEIDSKIFNKLMVSMMNKSDLVEKMVFSSFLNEKTKRHYYQSYQYRLKQLMKQA